MAIEVIRGHVYWGQGKDKGLLYYTVMLAYFLRCWRLTVLRPKARKIHVFDYPTVVWRPLSREPPPISAQSFRSLNLNKEKILPGASRGLDDDDDDDDDDDEWCTHNTTTRLLRLFNSDSLISTQA